MASNKKLQKKQITLLVAIAEQLNDFEKVINSTSGELGLSNKKHINNNNNNNNNLDIDKINKSIKTMNEDIIKKISVIELKINSIEKKVFLEIKKIEEKINVIFKKNSNISDNEKSDISKRIKSLEKQLSDS